jgi:hypothetical protein
MKQLLFALIACLGLMGCMAEEDVVVARTAYPSEVSYAYGTPGVGYYPGAAPGYAAWRYRGYYGGGVRYYGPRYYVGPRYRVIPRYYAPVPRYYAPGPRYYRGGYYHRRGWRR